MKHQFVHCHLHSEFSLLDGASRVNDIVNKAVENEMPAIAITDSSVMYSSVVFYQKAKSAGIKPLIGCEVLVAPKGRKDKTSKVNKHLVLIAQNYEGYTNLTRIVSNSYVDGFYYKPRTDHEILEQYSKGIIALSSCTNGEIPSFILRDDYDSAKKTAKFYKGIYGDNFYLEIQDHGLLDQKKVNPQILKLGNELGIKVIASNDCHYTNKEDALAREILRCIQKGTTLNTKPNEINNEMYIKSSEEMYQMFHEVPEVLSNTMEIADKCNLILPMGTTILPHFPLPQGHTTETYLRKISLDGLKHRYDEITPELTKRFDFELEIINSMGFPAYFLIVWDYTNYARENGIQVGPGRGSAAGSVIAYCLGITDIDPIPFNLLFERFLNPERVSMPDIDSDFCIERRGELIQYVSDKYGKSCVSQIVTLGTLGAKQVIRDVSKAMGYAVSDSERLSKMIPTGVGIKLKNVLEEPNSDLGNEVKINDKTKEIVDLALKLEGLSRHSSIHAAGVIIAKDPLENLVPIQKVKGETLVAQYQMTELEKLGLLKMDFLGLRNLTMISRAMTIIKQTRGEVPNLEKIGFKDKKTFDLLMSGETIGVFQLESPGMRKLVRKLEPNVFEEIIALIALYRPGPLGSGMVEKFVERKHGRQKIDYPHESIKNILEETYGLILYQEQIMQISQIIGGYTLGEADILRRAMGKKKLEEMQKQRARFLDGAAKNGVKPELAGDLFSTMEKFAEYGFNKSHSAAYAVITYRTAYLKANYPVEYMSALISSVMNTQDKVPFYTAECRRMGIKVLPPDVNLSIKDFSATDDTTLFGLMAVKGVGEALIEEIVREREEKGPYESLYDFCRRVPAEFLNKRAIESLCKAGAFDSFNKNRNQLHKGFEETYLAAVDKQKEISSGQTSLFGLIETDESDSSFSEAPILPNVEPYSSEDKLTLEKSVLGLYVSGHPIDRFSSHIDRFCSHDISDLQDEKDGVEITIGGVITGCMVRMTKKGHNMAIFNTEDLTGSIETIAFPKCWSQYSELMFNDAKVMIHGKVNIKDDMTKIIVKSIRFLKDIPYLEIKIPENTTKVRLVTMRKLLKEYNGETPVILKYHDSDVEIITSNSFWVNIDDDLMDKLSSFLGDNSVNLLN